MKNEVKFYVEKRKDKQTGELIDTNVPILLFYSFGGKRVQYYTGLRIDHISFFNGKEVVGGNKENAREINKELLRLKAKAHEIIDWARVNNHNLTTDLFKEKLRGDTASYGSGKNFLEALEEFYISSALTKTETTVRDLKATFNTFKVFSKDTRCRLDFSTITQEFYERFLQWCFHDKGYKNNYTGKLIKGLKTFLNWATEKGYNTNLEFRKKSFKKLREEPEIVFLTWEELMALFNAKFSSEERKFEDVRNMFCFSCFTGMRFSDVSALEKGNIFKDCIRYRVEKTEQSNTIPLNKYSIEIIKKYKNQRSSQFFPVYRLDEINDILKKVFKKLKFKRKIQQTHFQGAKAIKTVAPLHDVITFHISKKTFMTNFLAKGGTLLTAMSITGNKDFKTARRYYKVVDSLKSEEMKKVFG